MIDINKIIDDHFILTDDKVKKTICLDELKRVIDKALDDQRFKDSAWRWPSDALLTK